ncbi:acyltransferase family protein [Kineococcus sp. R8]|uniref:acyltransferase family protein n=1 Tax=Kineococcus siccus TaxID=2696567 RepID=UPI0014121D3E|nr:acyltransferase [Kineococcus siccus]NAZ81094.1 acyltransferase family protein [Kineococcus siccus]
MTTLRAVAAASVLMFHLGTWGVIGVPEVVERVGYTGVAFFFVLSGFVLAWGTRAGLPARTFWRRRFARTWPSHVTTLLAAAALPVAAVDRSWTAAAPNVLLLQAWSTDPATVYGMNGVSWSLSCEAFFYATFPAVLVTVRRAAAPRTWALCGALLLVAAAAALVRPGLAFSFPPVHLGEFVLGAVAGSAVRNGWRPRPRGAVVVGALGAGAAVSWVTPAPLPNVVMSGPFLLVLLWAAHRDLARRPGWLTSRVAVTAGEVSFAFYLVHELVIVNLREHLPPGALTAGVMTVSAGACAAALHWGVERPANRLLRDRPRPARTAATPTPP